MIIDDDEDKKISLRNRTLSDIPCYRSSLLWGAGGGITGGLLHFMFTSTVKKSSHVGMGTFMATTFGYWGFCRYKYSLEVAQLEVVKKALQHKTMYEGTPLEREIEGNQNLDLKSA